MTDRHDWSQQARAAAGAFPLYTHQGPPHQQAMQPFAPLYDGRDQQQQQHQLAAQHHEHACPQPTSQQGSPQHVHLPSGNGIRHYPIAMQHNTHIAGPLTYFSHAQSQASQLNGRQSASQMSLFQPQTEAHHQQPFLHSPSSSYQLSGHGDGYTDLNMASGGNQQHLFQGSLPAPSASRPLDGSLYSANVRRNMVPNMASSLQGDHQLATQSGHRQVPSPGYGQGEAASSSQVVSQLWRHRISTDSSTLSQAFGSSSGLVTPAGANHRTDRAYPASSRVEGGRSKEVQGLDAWSQHARASTDFGHQQQQQQAASGGGRFRQFTEAPGYSGGPIADEPRLAFGGAAGQGWPKSSSNSHSSLDAAWGPPRPQSASLPSPSPSLNPATSSAFSHRPNVIHSSSGGDGSSSKDRGTASYRLVPQPSGVDQFSHSGHSASFVDASPLGSIGAPGLSTAFVPHEQPVHPPHQIQAISPSSTVPQPRQPSPPPQLLQHAGISSQYGPTSLAQPQYSQHSHLSHQHSMLPPPSTQQQNQQQQQHQQQQHQRQHQQQSEHPAQQQHQQQSEHPAQQQHQHQSEHPAQQHHSSILTPPLPTLHLVQASPSRAPLNDLQSLEPATSAVASADTAMPESTQRNGSYQWPAQAQQQAQPSLRADGIIRQNQDSSVPRSASDSWQHPLTVPESPDPLNLLDGPSSVARGYHPSAFYADPAATGSPKTSKKRKVDAVGPREAPTSKKAAKGKKDQDAVGSAKRPSAPVRAKVSPERPAFAKQSSVIEVVIPVTSSSSAMRKASGKISQPAPTPRPPSTPSASVYVEIPPAGPGKLPLPKNKGSKQARNTATFAEIVLDSDSEQDAEGSDWDDLDLLETWSTPKSFLGGSDYATPLGASRVSNGPVKGSTRKVPMAKLRGMIEDIFEADDTLPDSDAMAAMAVAQPFDGPAEQFFEVIASLPAASASSGPSTTVAVLRFEVLQRLLKFVRQCSRSLQEMSGPARTTASGKPMDLASLPLQDLGRLCSILSRTVRLSEDLDPFPAHARSASPAKGGTAKRSMKGAKSRADGSPAITTPPPPAAGSDSNAPPETQTQGHTVAMGSRPSEPPSTDDALEDLNLKLAAATRSTLAAECCLAILGADSMPKPLLSEDLVRSCFDAIKTSLDKVILPFIEGCSSGAIASSHPLLAVLIQALAPQKARKKKNQQPALDNSAAGMAVLCRDSLSRLFRHTCSALYLVQRLVRIPTVSLSDSVVISAVYFSLGPFFVIEPEAAPSGGGSSEAARTSAAGRAAIASLGGTNAMKSLRLPALNLLRDIFATHAEQRQWIVEEILTSLTKLTDLKKNRRHYSLRNGKSIHSVNALLLQLIQAATHGLPEQVRSAVEAVKSRHRHRQKVASGLAEDGEDEAEDEDGTPDRAAEGAVSDSEDDVVVEMDAWRRGLEGAHQSAKAIVLFLLQRAGQAKVARSSQDTSYALMIDNLIQDLLNVLYLPDWPGAALLLSCFCRLFATCLEDPKGNPDTKGIALDHLGQIAARIRQSQLRGPAAMLSSKLAAVDSDRGRREGSSASRDASNPPLSPLPDDAIQPEESLSIVVALRDLDTGVVERMVEAYHSIFAYLARCDTDQQAMEGSMEFLVAQVQGELATAHSKIRGRLDVAIDRDAPSLEIARIHRFGKFLEDLIDKVAAWSLSEVEASAPCTDDSFRRTLALSERLIVSSSIMVSYEFMHAQLVDALDGQSVGNRSKALRGLGSISAVDPDLLDTPTVRSAVEIRLRDSSTIVRETAVGLLGKYVLRKPDHIGQYYDQLAGRIHDAGLAVRKRVLRLLKSFYLVSTSTRIRVDACARIVRCINDEDKVVQELALATIGEMWLPVGPSASQPSHDVERVLAASADNVARLSAPLGAEISGADVVEDALDGRGATNAIDTIMAVADVIREKPSPLEEVFRRLLKDRREPEASELLGKLQQLSDTMIDTLVESSEESTRHTVNRIKTVQLLVSTNPSILTIAKAKLLLPYLKAAQTSEELQIMELLLKIFRACLPWMPKTALAFAESLEKSLTPLVSRPPPAAQLQTMQELIACFCTVIVSHTHNFKILARTLKACFSRLQQMRVAAAAGKKVEDFPSWNRLTSLTALLCEHADFDDIRAKHPEAAADINSITPRPIVDAVSESLLAVYKLSSGPVRSFFLQNLGFLFRAYPSLMTRGSITQVMDDIFEMGSLQDRAMLLRIILDFLDADSARRDPDAVVAPAQEGRKDKREEGADGSVDMTVLVGNTESFADTGVGSAMMQRYSDPVLKATLEVQHPAVQRSATEILRFTVMQGLSHPIQCVPYLVALETTGDSGIRAKALQLHSHLASKHASLVQARFLDSAKTAFRFQLSQATPQTARGFRTEGEPSAMLNAWYSLLRDRRNTRLDFLRQVVKALDVNTAASECELQDVLFARFIADNLATLDYKTLEELFIVIGELRSILAVSGMQVLFMIQSALKRRAAGGTSAATDSLPSGGDTHVRPAEVAVSSSQGDDETAATEPEQAEGVPIAPPKALARMSIVSGTALLLRNHLKSLYNLAEARCAKFNPTKKQSAGADRPAVRRTLQDPSMAALSFDTMPLGLALIDTEDDAYRQMEAYAAMIEHEGTMLEPEDPEMMEELAL